ncbi:hypothetical protein [Clostridium beijerinckii]|uniref:Uncharacterized protein n=1 Tax=Clostridium beijerinckii TaxID=1520 RepID=A0A1S9N9X6_CLOBE|nr:hypothetical protein [Clostridium beijerinckii]OOP74113.1 hypothetical protein CBEIBR21_06340 [Clostridium beijerinckii]
MNNSNSFLQRLTLFCSNELKKEEIRKSIKHRIAIMLGKIFWIIIDKFLGSIITKIVEKIIKFFL